MDLRVRLAGRVLDDGGLERASSGELVSIASSDVTAVSHLTWVVAITCAALASPEAIRVAAADEVLDSLPDGSGTNVLDQGAALSGGQRQRLALARALGTEAPVLVLHDPTTAVDAVTEARIAETIRSLRDGRTTIVVTSSPALLSAADLVVFVDGGRIVASGDHRSLVGEAAYRAVTLA